jgi:hypothetical protein
MIDQDHNASTAYVSLVAIFIEKITKIKTYFMLTTRILIYLVSLKHDCSHH